MTDTLLEPTAEATTTDPLFQPISIRELTLRNRISMSPMTRYHSPDGVPGADVASYYQRRAEAGVGLIITEGVGIDHLTSVDDPAIPHLRVGGVSPMPSTRRADVSFRSSGIRGRCVILPDPTGLTWSVRVHQVIGARRAILRMAMTMSMPCVPRRSP